MINGTQWSGIVSSIVETHYLNMSEFSIIQYGDIRITKQPYIRHHKKIKN